MNIGALETIISEPDLESVTVNSRYSRYMARSLLAGDDHLAARQRRSFQGLPSRGTVKRGVRPIPSPGLGALAHAVVGAAAGFSRAAALREEGPRGRRRR